MPIDRNEARSAVTVGVSVSRQLGAEEHEQTTKAHRIICSHCFHYI